MAMDLLRKYVAIVIAHGICAITVSVLSGGAATAYAQSPSQREYEIQAAFVYNFAKFVDWPPDRFTDESASLMLCVIGEDTFGTTLEDTVAGKTVKGRQIGIRRIDNVDDVESCHLLFVGLSESERLRQIVTRSQKANVLTVGNMAEFIESGGIINLIKKANKIRFEINLVAAERARLKLDLKLLTLASSVIKKEPIFGVPNVSSLMTQSIKEALIPI